VPDRRTAIVDLGSNSFRLVVFTAGEGWWKRTDEIYEAVRIGTGLAATGELGKKPMARALETLAVFDHFCRATDLPPHDVQAVATSAIRDARNRDVFLERARGRAAFDVRVLSVEEEAHYGWLAGVNSTALRDGAVLDLGGGSLQLVETSGRLPGRMGSWPLGAVRMTERFLPGGEAPPRKRLRALRAHAAAELAGAPWLADAGRHLVGIGGTVRNLAAAALHEADWPSLGVQGFRLTHDALGALVDRLAGLPAAERGQVAGVKPSRADLILAGAVVVQTVLDVGGFDALEVTEAGLREGLFFEALLDGDPPVVGDARRESVLNLAHQYHVDPAHTAHVARLALGMFDELADAGIHPGDPVERELLWAACILHDVGVAVDYDDHHKHSRYLILNAGLPGFSPPELVLIAQAARFHRKGTPDLGPFAPVARPGDAQRLDRLATLLRLAEDLERARDQSVRSADVAVRDGTVRLDLRAEGEVGVARWAAERETELFRRAFGRRLQIA
jgi:exopolyphosphatase/guanosine-5'-triphosphate,3'-diphosphate pyrophosphatase